MTLKKGKHEIRYIVFIITVVVTISANLAIFQYNLSLQDRDAEIINIAGRQRMLSQNISKQILLISYANSDSISQLKLLGTITKEFTAAHKMLTSIQLPAPYDASFDKLYQSIAPHFNSIVNTSSKTLQHGGTKFKKNLPSEIVKVDQKFLATMEIILREYQHKAENTLKRTKRIVLILSLISILILLVESIFIVLPFVKTLNYQNAKLMSTNHKLSDFAHIASHNLRSPVMNLNSLIHFIDRTDDKAEKEALKTKVKTTLANLNNTMNALLNALSIQSNESSTIEELYFEDILTFTKETLSAQILKSEAIITMNFAEAPILKYDRLYLESIFQNLLSNALKYRSPDRIPEVHFLTKMKNKKIHLYVSDNGLGINMKRNESKLFGLNKVFHKHPEAKGVGLFMTRAQIESMGGIITAESTIDKGTTFKIIF